MIKLIKRSNLLEELPKIEPALERALTKTDLRDFWTIGDLINHVVNDEVVLFYQQDSMYVGVLQTTFAPRTKILDFFWSGKDPSEPHPVDWDEIDDFLIHVAKELGCGIIQCEGRRGWKPILTARGYSEDSVIYTKKVPYELPSV